MSDLDVIRDLVSQHDPPALVDPASARTDSSSESSESSESEDSDADDADADVEVQSCLQTLLSTVAGDALAGDALAAMDLSAAPAIVGAADEQWNDPDSDDEDALLRGGKNLTEEGGGGGGPPPRTKNELPPAKVAELVAAEVPTAPPPLAELAAGDELAPVGKISGIVDGMVVVAADAGANILAEGSTLALPEHRRVLGVVTELFGPTHKPLYSVAVPAEVLAAQSALICCGASVHVVTKQAILLDPSLHVQRGKPSDASNKDDEEVAAHEAEYSDDEQEQAAKAAMKQKKRERSAGMFCMCV